MENTDIAIIGAGVVGLSIAAALCKKFKNIVVLEKNQAFGRETSSRNSEVIHGGMYYPAGSLKARMCVEGRRLLYDICNKNNIAHRKIGKLIVATDREELAILNKILSMGNENGVEGLELVTRKELQALEPNVEGIEALHSPETGIIDSHQLMAYFFEKARDNGAVIVLNSEVTSIEKIGDGYNLSVNNNNEVLILKARVVINCAGLDSDAVAGSVGIDTEKSGYKLRYCKGIYFRVNDAGSKLIKRLVYPVPKPKGGGLGIHATPDLRGGMRLGPDDEYLHNRIKDYSVDNSKRNDFFVSAAKFMPFLKEDDLYPDSSGIRPKLGDRGDFRDFIIKNESGSGFPGFINLIGIESPGLTASAAIGDYVKNMVGELNG